LKYSEDIVRSGWKHSVAWVSSSNVTSYCELLVLGYHSYLQKNNIPFESMEAKTFNAKVFKEIESKARKASKELAKVYGEPELLKGYGLRNTTLMAIAP